MWWEHTKSHILQLKKKPPHQRHWHVTVWTDTKWTANVWFEQCSHSHQMKWVNTVWLLQQNVTSLLVRQSCRFSVCTRSHNKVRDSVYIKRYTRNRKKTVSFAFEVPPLTATRTFLTDAWNSHWRRPQKSRLMMWLRSSRWSDIFFL
jgi:hypothetical protein